MDSRAWPSSSSAPEINVDKPTSCSHSASSSPSAEEESVLPGLAREGVGAAGREVARWIAALAFTSRRLHFQSLLGHKCKLS